MNEIEENLLFADQLRALHEVSIRMAVELGHCQKYGNCQRVDHFRRGVSGDDGSTLLRYSSVLGIG